jgi:hypothetical protein
MDDSFAFQGTPDPRRVQPWAVKLGIAAIVVLVAVGLFGGWAASSEHRSLDRVQAANAAAARQASLEAERRTLAATQAAIATPAETVAGTATVVPSAAAQQAQDEAFAALRAAKALHRTTGTFAAAGPAQLSADQAGAVFVDGPSTTPDVVSVSASPTAWAAAVMSTDGVCYYVHVARTDAVGYGSGLSCTGADAMSANRSAW